MHIYEREVTLGTADSLDRIASLIERDKTVLDLGMGTGALGRHLQRTQNVVADGVTLSPVEAEHAQGSYRKIVVADLDTADLQDLFPDARYDHIVCADVFEHLKSPEKLLGQLADLLAPEGTLLASIPNAAYAGLIAELLAGEFRYRPEGLLDQTHLRFFTLRSIQRWLTSHGWRLNAIQRVLRPLSESEFQARIEALPPAVASYLTSAPEGGVYQYVITAQPLTADDMAVAEGADPGPAQGADFVAQLYWGQHGAFDEACKVVCRGRIGLEDQELVFELPDRALPAFSGLKFDPSDRVGYLRLLHMRLLDRQGQALWSWDGASPDSAAQALTWPRNDLLLQLPGPLHTGIFGLVYGPDPAIDLPLDEPLLRRLDEGGARLCVRLGWPMSADYLALAPAVGALQAAHQTERQRLALGHEQREAEHQAEMQRERQERIRQHDDLRHAYQDKQRLAEQTVQLEKNLQRMHEEQTQLHAQHAQLQAHVSRMEGLLVFRATRPLARLKNRLRHAWAAPMAASASMPSSSAEPLPRPADVAVDIIVPVYRSLEDTRACLQSLVHSSYDMPVRLVVINDCSPEPVLVEWLEAFAQQTHPIAVKLLHNPENLGFVGTVNKGMALNPQADVVLVNSDAVAAHNWLDRLQSAAYRSERVATATPFSNNATICSYPRFCQDNPLPPGETVATMDELCARHLHGQSVEIPTGHGFCMYIRRQALHDVGLFDEANFGKGYGEENDFCVRATQAGWRHVHALDVFVQHAGGVSFGDSKAIFESRAMQTMRRLHPPYEAAVHEFIARDPAARARRLLDFARICRDGRQVVLNITHNRQGGTLRHQHDLAQLLGEQVVFLQLEPSPSGVSLGLCGTHEELKLGFSLPAQTAELVDLLRLLRVGHVHFHHMLDQPDDVLHLPEQLGVRYDFTAHDYYSYCPQISLTDSSDMYCGEEGLDHCRACLRERPAPQGMDIEQWHRRHRPLLNEARYVICPTPGVAQRMARFAPQANTIVCPHPEPDSPLVPLLPQPDKLRERPLRVVVIGALSKIKGADVLEQTARLAARNGAPVEFHLIGYGYRALSGPPKARLTVHGAYEEAQLPQLLASLSADVAWFPVCWPETYSYTLSACIAAGLPIVASDTGAFSDRLHQRPLSWLHPWDSSPQDWLQHLLDVRDALDQAPPAQSWPEPAASDVAPWSYTADYLSELPAAPPGSSPGASPEELVTIVTSRGLLNNAQASEPRVQTVRLLARLQSAPSLSWLARRIPSHTKRRIKSWLIGNR